MYGTKWFLGSIVVSELFRNSSTVRRFRLFVDCINIFIRKLNMIQSTNKCRTELPVNNNGTNGVNVQFPSGRL